MASLSPDAFTNADAHVRMQVSAHLIRQYTCLALLGRSNATIARSIHRQLMLEVSRQSEICLRRFRQFSAQNGLRELDIDTWALQVGANGIASHLIRGEVAQAKLLEERILADESEDESITLAGIITGTAQAARAA